MPTSRCQIIQNNPPAANQSARREGTKKMVRQ